jgi:hypothetical protein
VDKADKNIPLARKLGFIFVAWVVVAVLTFPIGMYDPVLFPAGLLPMLAAGEAEDRHSWAVKVGWLVYIALMSAAE